MRKIQSFGGPLMGIDRQSLSHWGGVFHSLFFMENPEFENDYEEMCGRFAETKSNNLSALKGVYAEAILIHLPLPTLIVSANGTSVHIAQIWSSEQGWSEADLTMDDFWNATDWKGSVDFFCGGGEFLIFDSSCPHEDIDEHFNISLEKGAYRCESCDQKRQGEAQIVLIRMVKQA